MLGEGKGIFSLHEFFFCTDVSVHPLNLSEFMIEAIFFLKELSQK